MTDTVTSTNTKTYTWLRLATALLLVGALAWLAKFAAIAVTEWREGTLPSVLWVIGFSLMLAGSAALAVWLTARWHVVLRIVSALIGSIVFFVSMNVIDEWSKSVFGGAGPEYVQDEWGILLAAILWLCVGLGAGAFYRSTESARAS